jgi:hypothetical protein
MNDDAKDPEGRAKEAASVPVPLPSEPGELVELLQGLSPRHQLAAAKLTSLLLMYANADASLDAMLREIDQISLYGAEPERQLQQLEALLERWRPKH